MRIHITGNAGAGKTTLAKDIARTRGLPVHHLDKVVWAPNWTKPGEAERNAKIADLVAQPDWIIEGVSEIVRRNADIVVVLTTPTYKCLYRCIARCFRVGFKTRDELPRNCPEIAILFRAIKIVLKFQERIGNQLLLEAKGNPRYIVCRDGSRAVAELRLASQNVLGGSAGTNDTANIFSCCAQSQHASKQQV